MEREEIQDKKSKVLLFIIVGIVLVVIAVVAFLIWIDHQKTEPTIKESNNNSTVNDSNSNSQNNDNSNPNEPNSNNLFTTSEDLMKLIPNKSTFQMNSNKILSELYIGKKLEAKDIDMGILLVIVYENVPDSEKYYSDFNCSEGSIKLDSGEGNFYCYNKNVVLEEDESLEYAITEETMKVYLAKYYGDKIQYKRVDEFEKDFVGYAYQSGYYFSPASGGGFMANDGFGSYHVQFQKEETNGDEKYIYMLYVYSILHCSNEECSNSYVTLYKDQDLKEKIADNVTDKDDIEIEPYIKIAGDKAAVYKHTYKKNSDGSYYWYSVEPVK